MKYLIVILLSFWLPACQTSRKVIIESRPQSSVSGSVFYRQVMSINTEQREVFAAQEIMAGNIPSFLGKFIRIRTSVPDSSGQMINAYYFVAPDYLSVGTDRDFARIPLTPMTAQQIADHYHCFLPTRKMVDDIYKKAIVKLEPQPMFAFRDSAATFFHHHLIIEGQRQKRKGLIAGIKKDVVISGKITQDGRPDRVAIYGWHRTDGIPIQPLYTGHINWYVDYSHGIRLVYEIIYVNGKPMNYVEVLKDANLRKLLCDEDNCDFYRYGRKGER